MSEPSWPARGKIAAIEEHYWTEEIRATFEGLDIVKAPHLTERLVDFSALRITEMDAAGIDIQLLSHVGPGTAKLAPDHAVTLARAANDQLAAIIRANPTRFAGFAELPTPDPKGAADELSRCVGELGFKGAMLNGLTHDRFLDEEPFWPILERAQSLGVPLYFHPSTPHPAVVEAYYKDQPTIARAAWGFGVETGTQAIRFIVGGTFDRFPELKIILGHLGESLPFWLWRADMVLNRMGHLKRKVRDYVTDHVYITTSGNFSQPAFNCCLQELGADKILFAVDWPWQSNIEGRAFIEQAQISDAEKTQILSQNAQTLLKL